LHAVVVGVGDVHVAHLTLVDGDPPRVLNLPLSTSVGAERAPIGDDQGVAVRVDGPLLDPMVVLVGDQQGQRVRDEREVLRRRNAPHAEVERSDRVVVEGA